MNLRILKKLSKRAAPLLAQIGDYREQFFAEKWDNYTSSAITSRKHWERSRCHPSHASEIGKNHGLLRSYYRSRAGHVICMSAEHIHPRKGTPMVGATSGYYEPEWDEETAWDALSGYVHAHFTDYECEGGPKQTRIIKTPSDVFRAADEIISTSNV